MLAERPFEIYRAALAVSRLEHSLRESLDEGPEAQKLRLCQQVVCTFVGGQYWRDGVWVHPRSL